MENFLKDRKSLLFLLAVGNSIAFATWQVLLNNFVVERAAFTGEEIGLLQSLREVPGFLAFTAIGILIFIGIFNINEYNGHGIGVIIQGSFLALFDTYYAVKIKAKGF